MDFSKSQADRIRKILIGKKIPFEEKKLFGRLNFQVYGEFCIGICGEDIEVRINSALFRDKLQYRKFKFTDGNGRRMNDFLMIEAEEVNMDCDLEEWIEMALDYNREKFGNK